MNEITQNIYIGPGEETIAATFTIQFSPLWVKSEDVEKTLSEALYELAEAIAIRLNKEGEQ